jgi:dynein heavy chain
MSDTITECTDTIKMVHTWKEAYYCVRLKIEQSGKEERWEFDKKRLFGEADYIASVAKDVLDIAKVFRMRSCRLIRRYI